MRMVIGHLMDCGAPRKGSGLKPLRIMHPFRGLDPLCGCPAPTPSGNLVIDSAEDIPQGLKAVSIRLSLRHE